MSIYSNAARVGGPFYLFYLDEVFVYFQDGTRSPLLVLVLL